MKPDRIRYRLFQFWHALRARPTRHDLEQVRRVLAPPLYSLFLRQAPDEQAHSIHLYHKLLARGENNPHLLAAALLHDCGKSRFPLRLWERVIIVLGKAFFPQRARRWGRADLTAPGNPAWRVVLQRPFAVAEQHPAWGAEMVAQAGGSPLTILLIRRHQDYEPESGSGDPDHLLQKLQAVDDES